MKKLVIMLALFIALPITASAQVFEQVTKFYELTFTKDSVTTTYAANDAVSEDTSTTPSLLVFPLGARDGVGGRIKSAIMVVDTPNTTNGTFDLMLYSDSASVTAVKDSATYVLTAARALKYIGKIAFTLAKNGAGDGGAGVAAAFTSSLDIPFQPTQKSKNIYGQIVATAAWVASQATTIRIKIGYVQE